MGLSVVSLLGIIFLFLGHYFCYMFSLFRILSANSLLKDAFREVGLVESLTWTVLHFISTDKSNISSVLSNFL